jgi:hypothetical protein
MPIQIPPQPKLNLTGRLGSRRSLDAAGAPAAALGSVGNAIAGLGDGLMGVAFKVQEANDKKLEAEAGLSFYEASQKYMHSLEGDFNEESWVPGAEALANEQMAQALANENLTPKAKERLEFSLRKMKTDFLLKVGETASKQIADRAIEANLLRGEVAIKNNDLAGFNESVDALTGFVSPEKQARLKLEGEDRFRFNQMQEKIMGNPKGMLERFENGDFDDMPIEQRAPLQRMATAEANKEKRDFYNNLGLAMSLGERPSVGQIKQWVDEGKMDAGHGINMINNVKSLTPQTFDAKKYINLANRINNYDPNLDDEAQSELTALAVDVNGSGFTGGNMSRLRTRLQSKIDGETSRKPTMPSIGWPRTASLGWSSMRMGIRWMGRTRRATTCKFRSWTTSMSGCSRLQKPPEKRHAKKHFGLQNLSSQQREPTNSWNTTSPSSGRMSLLGEAPLLQIP